MATAMIGSVLLIAGAEAAVYRHDNMLYAWTLDKQGELLACHERAQLFQDCPAEKRMLHDVRDLAQVREVLQGWVHCQRALLYLISGMDNHLRQSTRTLGLELAEEALSIAANAEFARHRLLGCPLADDADLAGALHLAQAFPRCYRLYQDLTEAHHAIGPVREVLAQLANGHATPAHNAQQILVALVEHGVAAAAALALAEGEHKAIEELLWQFSGNKHLLANCPQLLKLLEQLCNQLLALLPTQTNKSPLQTALFIMQEKAPYVVTPSASVPLIVAPQAKIDDPHD
jgi:hypothetical protein